MVLLGVLGVAAGLALASSQTPTPTITSHPASPTTSTTGSFTFSDSLAKVTFVCSLDGSAYSACTSPKTYSGLAQGSHTFRVEARTTSGAMSDPASNSWTIVLTPPVIAIAFPAAGSSSNAGGWSAGCPEGAGVCGTASDPSGVTSVIVSIMQNASGRYWNGSGYRSTTEVYTNAGLWHATAAGASWFAALPLPSPDGQYTLHTRAVDGLWLQTPSRSPATSVFTIDTIPPPAPTITGAPANPTNQASASFSFTDSEARVAYLCRLEGGLYSACSSPKIYSGLAQGTHTVSIETTDAAGNTSSPTRYSWVIDTTPPPEPVITQHPTDPTSSSSATFAFNDSEAGVSFQCRLDAAAWTPCSSPATYNGLGVSQHDFYVRALDAAGNHSGAAHFEFDVTQQTSQPFTITGNPSSPLYPGAAAIAIPVKLTNPNSVPIYVTSLAAAVQSTGMSACSASWFSITQSTVSSAGVQVPANGAVTLPAPGATAPGIQMIDSHTNQNACAGAKLTLSYTGSVHS